MEISDLTHCNQFSLEAKSGQDVEDIVPVQAIKGF
jgi:hypothetical protein